MIPLRLYELKAMQKAKTWKHFIYLSENQPGYDDDGIELLKVNLTFASMTIFSDYPTMIVLTGTCGRLWINAVKTVDCEPNILGDLLKITCQGEQQYLIVAQS